MKHPMIAFKFKKPESFKRRTIRAIRTLNISALMTIANDIAKDYFAKYMIVDNHGTNKACWTMAGAESWFSACGSEAYILETYDYTVLSSRIQSN